MIIQQLTSSSNPYFKSATKLREGRARRKQARFLIDGQREIERAIQCQFQPIELYFTSSNRSFIQSIQPLDRLADVRAYEITDAMMKTLAYGQREDDVVAVCQVPSGSLENLQLLASPLIAVLDNIEKPGNIGAIFRTADAVGADAVLLSDCGGDPFNPNAIRASSGTVFSVPFASDSASNIIEYLVARNIRIVTTRVDAHQSHWDCDWSGGIALVIGSEATGISDAWRKTNMEGIRIPMAGIADSLNASITAAICLYEAARNRSGSLRRSN